MSRKLDLDEYLSRYQNDHYKKTTTQDIKHSRLKHTTSYSTFKHINSTIKENLERDPQRFYRSRVAIND
jgi:conjugal transfer/entry exclusion protein